MNERLNIKKSINWDLCVFSNYNNLLFNEFSSANSPIILCIVSHQLSTQLLILSK